MKSIRKILYVFSVLALFIFIMYFTVRHTTDTAILSDLPGPSNEAPKATIATIPEVKLLDKPILYDNLVCYEFDTLEDVNIFISDVDKAVNKLLVECSAPDKYTASAITLMLEEVDRLTAEQTNALRQKEYITKWNEKEKEYFYATRTWKYLKALGYSDVACAGILGNLMAECGGHTLKLDPFLYDTATEEYYGMFQWSLKYYPDVEGMTFEEQLDYYAKTSSYIFNTWGRNYAEGFTLDDFNSLTDPREAALAFAKIYERCASWTYERRQNFSEIAYQYFVLDF